MKTRTRFLLLGMCMLLLCSCSVSGNNNGAASAKNTAADVKCDGIYVYDYEHDSEELKEDHYIVLETKEGLLAGRYYGTSDEFDEAREGYLPGFFVSDMHGLVINEDEISFEIVLEGDNLFSKPVKLNYINGAAVPAVENPFWENRYVFEGRGRLSKGYKGKITKDEITFDLGDEKRVFRRAGSL